MSRLRKLITWTQYLPTSAPFWQMEVIHIIFISRYLKKPVQFHKMRWFWISRKDENMLEALKWNLNLELKLGCTQTSEKLVLRYQFTMSFLLSGNLFQNWQLFFLIKGSKCILTCKYQSKEISMCNIPKYFHFIFSGQKPTRNWNIKSHTTEVKDLTSYSQKYDIDLILFWKK